jgi:hypothetical protein
MAFTASTPLLLPGQEHARAKDYIMENLVVTVEE